VRIFYVLGSGLRGRGRRLLILFKEREGRGVSYALRWEGDGTHRGRLRASSFVDEAL
jgi:hypothetical protein